MGNIQRSDGNKCPICGLEDISISSLEDKFSEYNCYSCSNCGDYFALETWWSYYVYNKNNRKLIGNEEYDLDKLKSYLFYHKGEMRPFLVDEKTYSKFEKNDFSHIYNLSPTMVESWYPKTFAEKVDKILLYLAKESACMGDSISLTILQLGRVYFIINENYYGKEAALKFVENQVDYFNSYLIETGYITIEQDHIFDWNNGYRIMIAPKGWARIDELQKNKINNVNVFIAMKFGEDTLELRKTLKLALLEMGYNPILIDEVQYNGQIVPEMLYQIRESRFVIAELSHHNNGAYYEAGYALGIGKEVIHICEEDAIGSKLHFDVKQVNTITYKADDMKGLKERLIKRIQATIK